MMFTANQRPISLLKSSNGGSTSLRARKTKIICTIGPAVSSREKLDLLARNGMDLARLNFSHGRFDEFERIIKDLRSIESDLRRPIGILADIQGPKIRVGDLPPDGIQLKEGDSLWIFSGSEPGGLVNGEMCVTTTYRDFVKDVGVGRKILFDDGLISVRSVERNGDKLRCIVENGGRLKSHKGINVPEVPFSAHSITEKDYTDILFCLEHGVDYIALSFVRSAQEVRHLKSFIQSRGKSAHVIAKIEKQEALNNLEAIIETADGILIARGDLAVEVGNELVPVLQKKIIRQCNIRGKAVIIATQMLMSMVESPRPSRAEASDVANAIVDGTDALMLSNETAVGKYPVESLQMMGRIVEEMELEDQAFKIITHDEWRFDQKDERAMALLQSAVRLGSVVRASAMVVVTQSGKSALLMSKCRPKTPLIAITGCVETYRQLSMRWGVTALFMEDMQPLLQQTSVFEAIAQRLLSLNLCSSGDKIVITAGLPLLAHGSTNTIKVQDV